MEKMKITYVLAGKPEGKKSRRRWGNVIIMNLRMWTGCTWFRNTALWPAVGNFLNSLSTVCLPKITLPYGVSYLALKVTSQ
jgi:hypothetical protein